MIVKPDEISARSAPSTSPLKHWETKLDQLITAASKARIGESARSPESGDQGYSRTRSPESPLAALSGPTARALSVATEVAAEGIRLLHQRLARKNLEDL